VTETKTRPGGDALGYLLFAVPPLIGLLALLFGWSIASFHAIPLLLGVLVFLDAPRWGQPRWLWVPLVVLLWLLVLPIYGIFRRVKGAPAHWALGLGSMASVFALIVAVFVKTQPPPTPTEPGGGSLFHDFDDD